MYTQLYSHHEKNSNSCSDKFEGVPGLDLWVKLSCAQCQKVRENVKEAGSTPVWVLLTVLPGCLVSSLLSFTLILMALYNYLAGQRALIPHIFKYPA